MELKKIITSEEFMLLQVLVVPVMMYLYPCITCIKGEGILPLIIKGIIAIIGTAVLLMSYLIRKKIPIALWIGIVLLIFVVGNFIYAKSDIYILIRRDNTINVIDHGLAFIPPFSCKKIYSLPQSKTLELMSTLYDNEYQKIISGKFKIIIDVQTTGNLDGIKLSDLYKAVEDIEHGLFETCFNAFLYKDCEEIKRAILQNQETYPTSNIFCGHFHPQSYQLIDDIIINWDGGLNITELKISPALL